MSNIDVLGLGAPYVRELTVLHLHWGDNSVALESMYNSEKYMMDRTDNLNTNNQNSIH